MFKFWSRILFAIKYKSVRRIAVCDGPSSFVAVYHRGKEVRMRRRCPHQGAPLETGYIEGDDLVCPWHGCRFSLIARGSLRRYVSTLRKAQDKALGSAPLS